MFQPRNVFLTQIQKSRSRVEPRIVLVHCLQKHNRITDMFHKRIDFESTTSNTNVTGLEFIESSAEAVNCGYTSRRRHIIKLALACKLQIPHGKENVMYAVVTASSTGSVGARCMRPVALDDLIHG